MQKVFNLYGGMTVREYQHQTIDMFLRVDKALRSAEQHLNLNMQTMSTQQFEAAKSSIIGARAQYEGASHYFTEEKYR